MTLKRYVLCAVIAFLMVAAVFTLGPWHLIGGVLFSAFLTAFFTPTIVACYRNLKHRVWIVIFNFVCFPVAWVMMFLLYREQS
jgi:hypothetical protein